MQGPPVQQAPAAPQRRSDVFEQELVSAAPRNGATAWTRAGDCRRAAGFAFGASVRCAPPRRLRSGRKSLRTGRAAVAWIGADFRRHTGARARRKSDRRSGRTRRRRSARSLDIEQYRGERPGCAGACPEWAAAATAGAQSERHRPGARLGAAVRRHAEGRVRSRLWLRAAQGLCAGRRRLPQFRAQISERPSCARCALLAWRGHVPAPALSRRRGILPHRHHQVRNHRQGARLAAAAGPVARRARRKRSRPARRSPRSGANIHAPPSG